MKKITKTNEDIHVALLQIRSTPLEPGLLSPATLLFSHPMQGIMPIIKRLPINLDNDDECYEVSIKRQAKNDKKYDTARNYDLFLNSIYYSGSVGGWWTMDPWHSGWQR